MEFQGHANNFCHSSAWFLLILIKIVVNSKNLLKFKVTIFNIKVGV